MSRRFLAAVMAVAMVGLFGVGDALAFRCSMTGELSDTACCCGGHAEADQDSSPALSPVTCCQPMKVSGSDAPPAVERGSEGAAGAVAVVVPQAVQVSPPPAPLVQARWARGPPLGRSQPRLYIHNCSYLI